MEKFWTVLEIIAPIFAAIGMGFLARKRQLITREGADGLQQFAIKIALPCVLFSSCMTSSFGLETVTSMVILWPLLIVIALVAFRARKGSRFPYHNLPLLFAAKEGGMLGVPLFLLLFGQEHIFRFATLDVAQIMVAATIIAILSAGDGEKLSVKAILKKIFTSPFLLSALSGVLFNVTGLRAVLDGVGIGGVLMETVSFLGGPLSAVILFCIGYNFSLEKEGRKQFITLTALHYAVFAVFCLVAQAALFLVPGVTAETRWAMLLYCATPPSFLAPGLARSDKERTIASGVCSMATVVTLLVFCIMTIATA